MTVTDLHRTPPALGARVQRSIGIALFIALALAGTVVAAVLTQQAAYDTAVIAIAMAMGAAVALALAVHRPVLFPFLAYIAAVPFDNLLQTGGGTITKFLGIASAIAFLLVMLDRRRTIAPPIAIVGWAAFLVWSVASLAWANDPAFGTQSLLQVCQLFVLCTIVATVRVRVAEIKPMMVAAVIGGVASSLYGVYMFTSGHISKSDALSQRLSISLGTHSFINADHFAGALVFPMAIALTGFLRLRSWGKVASGVAFLLLLTGVLVSATRGAVIALAVMGVYLAIVERRRIQLVMLAVLGLAASAAVPNIWLRFLDPEQGDLGGRSGLWKIAAAAFRQHWLAGAGTGNFRLAYRDAYLSVSQPGFFYHRWMEDSHNLIVNTSVELGVVGVILILAAWVLQFRTTERIPRTSVLGGVRSAIEAGTIGLFVVAMTVDIMWYKYLWIAFMLAIMARNAWLADARPAAKRAALAARAEPA